MYLFEHKLAYFWMHITATRIFLAVHLTLPYVCSWAAVSAVAHEMYFYLYFIRPIKQPWWCCKYIYVTSYIVSCTVWFRCVSVNVFVCICIESNCWHFNLLPVNARHVTEKSRVILHLLGAILAWLFWLFLLLFLTSSGLIISVNMSYSLDSIYAICRNHCPQPR